MIKRLARLLAALTLLASAFVVIPPPKALAAQPERIVYTHNNDEIMSVKPDGTDQQSITTGYYPNVSPDGTKIAIVRSDANGVADIYVANTDGTNETKITNNPIGYNMHNRVAWSPDGSKIAFARNALQYQDPEANKDIFIINADGSNEINLTNDQGLASNTYPDWSPDGTKIAYASNDGIHTVTPDGTDDQLLISTGGIPHWSPDGQKILYETGSSLYVANADGSNVVSLGAGNQASWSPDSSKVAYIGGSPSSAKIINSDGTGVATIYKPNRGGGVTSISWSPDGSRVVFCGGFPNGDDPQYTMYIANIFTNTLTGVISYPWGAKYATWIGDPDTTPPTIGSFTLTRKTSAQTENFSVSATDTESGVAGGEFYYGNDPGQGNGTAMAYANGQLSGTLGTDMPVGTYQVYVRAVDNAGNWSTPSSAKLVVTETGTTRVTASGSFTPSAAAGDQLPSLDTATFKLAQYNQNVSFGNSGIVNSSSANFTYTYGNTVLCGALPVLPGCHQMTFTTSGNTAITSLIFSGTNNSQASVSGTAQVTVDGITTTNPFTITAVSAARAGGSSNNYQINIYNPGSTTTPENLLYTASNTGTVNIN